MTTAPLRQQRQGDATTPRAGTVQRARLAVDPVLADFIEREALPGTGIEAEHFWSGLADLADCFTPQNRDLLARRELLQGQIDDWHRTNPDAGIGVPPRMLREMGYLVPEPEPFTIGTANVDPEIATIAGPQLVVPALNARFVLNAVNARW